MIIETPYKVGDTVTIKTTAGEEVIARLVGETDKAITITKAMAIVATQNGIGLGPFSFTADPDAKLVLNKRGVLYTSKTVGEMATQYIKSTTGLDLPN